MNTYHCKSFAVLYLAAYLETEYEWYIEMDDSDGLDELAQALNCVSVTEAIEFLDDKGWGGLREPDASRYHTKSPIQQFRVAYDKARVIEPDFAEIDALGYLNSFIYQKNWEQARFWLKILEYAN